MFRNCLKSGAILAGLVALVTPGVGAAAPLNVTKVYAEKGNVSEDQAEQAVGLVFDSIRSELQAGRDVQIKNFGRFRVSELKARQGRNPRTGEPLAIPARRYPRFTAADGLKFAVNGEEKPAKKEKVAKAATVPAVPQAKKP